MLQGAFMFNSESWHAWRAFWSRLKASFRRGTVTCPFCFERFRLRDTAFRCENPSCVAPNKDALLNKLWGEDSFARVFTPGGVRFESHCPMCGVATATRACPHCHKALPETFGLNPEHVIAVIGAKNVGKSHFLAVLIDHIRKGLGARFDMTIEFLDEETNRRYMHNLYNPVFRDHKTINVTKSANVDHAVRLPLLYRLSRRTEKGLETLATLAFFDTAGEDLTDQAVMGQLYKYIVNAQGIILLLDPLQIDAVREQLTIPLPEKEADPLDIMQRVTNLILRDTRYGSSAKINTPIAVCFSKFDTLLPLTHPSYQILQKSNHNGVFDKLDCDAIQGEIEAMLTDWEYTGLLNLIKVRYRQYAFFCVSALGNAPTGNRLGPVQPFRIEDPFLWLLYAAKKIQ